MRHVSPRYIALAVFVCGGVLAASPIALADSYSQTECAWDNSYTYHVCIEQENTTGHYYGRYTLSVQDYNVRFTGGSLGVSISGATVLAGVEGVGTKSHHFYASSTQQWRIGRPRMGHIYTFRPRWANDPVIIAGPHIYQCGRSDSTVRHGHSRWTLSTPNDCQGAL
jgi:hypothetical protein